MWKSATFAIMAPLALAGCMMPGSRMPPSSPVHAASMSAPVAAPVYSPVAPAYTQPVPQPAMQPAMGQAFPGAVPGLPPSSEPPPSPARGIAGLTERKPDLCGAERQASAIGRPGSAIPALGLTRSYRIVEYRGIEPQDYVPDRMVFRLDASGNISNIDCG